MRSPFPPPEYRARFLDSRNNPPRLVAALALAALVVTRGLPTYGQSDLVEASADVSFAAVDVGETSPPSEVVFTFGDAVAVGAVQVLTDGATDGDFQAWTAGTCGPASYVAGASCTVSVVFSPLAAGARRGAVVLYDTSAPPQPLATAFLSGTGIAPAIGFGPGVITTVAGTGTLGYAVDNVAATASPLNYATGLTVDGAGNLYIADYSNNRIRRVDALTGVISTIAGTGAKSFAGDGGPAAAAALNLPIDVAIDAAGNLFVADAGNRRVRRISATTGVITTVAGGGSGCEQQINAIGDGCPATNVALSPVLAVAVDGAGDLYVTDKDNDRIRRVDRATGVITTVAGAGGRGYNGDDISATSAQLNQPEGIALDAAGNLYIADSFNARVRKVDAESGVITTVAGTGTAGYGGDGGPAIDAELMVPTGIAVNAAGDVFIADRSSGWGVSGRRIRKVSGSTGVIATVAGNGTSGNSTGDGGPATSARLNPFRVIVDAAGDLWISDAGTRVRKVDVASAPALTFPPTAAGATSAAEAVIVTNTGNAPLAISDITTTGSFSLAGNTCPIQGSLDPGSTCVLAVQFTPGVDAIHTGTLALTDNTLNVTGATQQLTLSGMGGLASALQTTTTLNATSTSLMFGEVVTVTATIAWTGSTSAPGRGIVTFFQGSRHLGSSALTQTASTTARAELSVAANWLGAGGHEIVAVYSGNPDSLPSSGTLNLTVAAHGEPAVLLPVGGTPQSATPGTDFSTPLKVRAVDVYGNPVPGVPLSFEVDPNSVLSAGATLSAPSASTGQTGEASVVASANNNAGPYIVRATAGTLSAEFELTNLGPLGAAVGSETQLTLHYWFPSVAPTFALHLGLDFALGQASCSGSTAVSCSVPLTFLPTAPGLRADAVVITDASGNVIRTTLLAGIGQGSAVAFTPGVIDAVEGTVGISGATGTAVDMAGNLYIADTANNRIRRVDPTGTVTIVAGGGTSGLGDGGAATDAELNAPRAVAVDGAGNLYIADTQNNRIRKVDAGGTITTLAGGGTTSDPRLATSRHLNGPAGVAVDMGGIVYFSDTLNGRIYRVSAEGDVAHIAGGGSDFADTAGLSTLLDRPSGLAVDVAGNLYVAVSGHNIVRRVDLTTRQRMTTRVAGGGSQFTCGDATNAVGDGCPATLAILQEPTTVAVDGAGNLYIADRSNFRIRKVDANGAIGTVAGNGMHHDTGFTGWGSDPTRVRFNDPAGVALDAAGNLYISDGHRIAKLSVTTSNVTFKATSVGETNTLSLLVSNVGTLALHLEAIDTTSGFHLQTEGSTCTTGAALAVGATCALVVEFGPTAAGSPVTGTLTLIDDAFNSAQVVQLRGTASLPPTHFALVTPPAVEGDVEFEVTITALDEFENPALGYGGTVHLTSSDSLAVLPADQTFVPGSGTKSVRVALMTPGTQTIAVTDTGNASISGTSSGIAVAPAEPAWFEIVAPPTTVAGTPFSFTVTAVTASSRTAAFYTGTVHFHSQDAQAVLPADYTFTSEDHGAHTFIATLNHAGYQWISATDSVKPWVTRSVDVMVNSVAATRLSVSVPTTATAFSPITVLVEAVDAFGNRATGYQGTVHFSSSDGQATVPADALLTGGFGQFSVTLRTSGTHTITVRDAVDPALTATSGGIAVSEAPPIRLVITCPESATAGTTSWVVVTAVDPSNNRAADYRGTVRLTSSDPRGDLPAAYAFTEADGGMRALQVVLRTAGDQTVTVTDTSDPALTATSIRAIGVSGAAATRFVVSAPAAATALNSVDFTVSALDPFDNAATSSAPVRFTSTDPDGLLPADYAFAPSDHGIRTFAATLRTPGTHTITATSTANVSHTGTSNTIAVSPGVAANLVVSAPASATAGTLVSITITAVDALGNTAAGYRGTAHFTSGDPRAVLPTDYTFTGEDAGTHTFTVELQTAGAEQTISITDIAHPALDGVAILTVVPAAVADLAVSAPGSAVAGSQLPFTVVAMDRFFNRVPAYAGTVTFSSGDAQAVLPSDATFFAADAGARAFTASLRTAGFFRIVVTDTADGLVTGTSNQITVTAGAAAQFVFDAPGSATAGVPFIFSVRVRDAFGNAAMSGYTGTVHFTSSDGQAVLAGDAAIASGGYVTVFSATLGTPGAQTITATDTADASIFGGTTVIVSGAPPVFSAHPDLVLEAESPQGAVAAFTLVATTWSGSAATVACSPASGSVFPAGATTVTCTATDPATPLLQANAHFHVSVRDTTPPLLHVPESMTVAATDANGSAITYDASATDIADPSPILVCGPASGARFPIGTTSVTCTATDHAVADAVAGHSGGLATTAQFDVTVADTTPPIVTAPPAVVAEATAPTGTIVSYGAPSANDNVGIVSIGCSPPSGSEFSIGETTVVCTARDGAGNEASAATTVTVQDTMSPTLTAIRITPANDAEWNNSSVSAEFSCTDSGSGVASLTAAGAASGTSATSPLPVTVAVEGEALAVVGRCVDLAGNAMSVTLDRINIDLTPPNPPAIIIAPSPNSAGWNRGAAIVSFNVNGDAGAVQSGVAGCTPAIAIANETPGTPVSGTCADRAGNVSAPAATTLKLDMTAPGVSITGVTDGAVYTAGAVPVPGCATVDALSGVATNATASITGGATSGAGTFTVTCSGATDAAGNAAPPVSATYSVRYNFIGFRSPLVPGQGSYSGLFKLGRTIPVKWQLTDARGAYISSLATVAALKVSPSGDCAGIADGTPLDPGITGNASLRYDAGENQFVFNWDTTGLAAGCYGILLSLDDNGPPHSTIVRLR